MKTEKKFCKIRSDKNEEYKEIMKPTTMQNIIPRMKVLRNKHTIWRKNNLNKRQYIDANKLANAKRQILRDKRLTDTEISQLEEAAKNMIPERNAKPVLIMETLDNEEIEQMINKIRKGDKMI